MNASPLSLTPASLSIADVVDVARGERRVEVGEHARAGIARARAVVESCAGGAEAMYGINTGFGSFSRIRIGAEKIRDVQLNLVRSHAAGVGAALPVEVVRAMMVILAASLARGRSGARPELVQAILDLLNGGVTPIVPSRGSVGASGDLAPLAHLALVLLGEGEAWHREHPGRRFTGADALAAAGLRPIELEAKEGLALINGTHLMAAIGALAIADTDRLVTAAISAAAMAIDACRGTDAILDHRIHDARNQPGQRRVAEALARRLVGSEILASHRVNDPRVQDPYSLRAAPQVIGAVVDTLDHVRGVFLNELGGVTDNPLVFPEPPHIVSGGNFHGMPLAIALDSLAVALAHLAGISERRVFWLLAADDSENPVSPFLSPEPGLLSGLMITQYTAAACCNELRALATPASVGNIPTAAGIEDYNSMGATSAHQVRAAVDLATSVVAIELLVMAEAMEYQRPLKSGPGVERTYQIVRTAVAPLTDDRPPAPDIATIEALIRAGAFALD